MANLNRLKIALIEQGKTGKWLAEQLGKREYSEPSYCRGYRLPQPRPRELGRVTRNVYNACVAG